MAFKLQNIKDIFNKKKKEELAEVANVNAGEGAVSSDSFVKTNLSDEDIEATQAAHDEIKNIRLRKQRLIKKILIIIIAIIVIIVIIRLALNAKKKQAETEEVMKNVSKVRIMNISSEISGSGTLKPKICPLCKNIIQDIICLNKNLDNEISNEMNETEEESKNNSDNEVVQSINES